MNAGIPEILSERVHAALRAALGPEAPVDAPAIQQCNDPKFGDYQFNGALPLAKQQGKNPRELATAILEALDVGDVCEPPDIAAPHS